MSIVPILIFKMNFFFLDTEKENYLIYLLYLQLDMNNYKTIIKNFKINNNLSCCLIYLIIKIKIIKNLRTPRKTKNYDN